MRLKALVSRQWWWTTLIVIAAIGVLIWLGFWQLDRLDQRRANNARIAERWRQELFDVNREQLPENLEDLGYRRVQVSGEFDVENQIILSNQMRGNVPGVQLITPLRLDDGRAVLVARGWIPVSEAEPEKVRQYDERADGAVIGLIQQSQSYPNGDPVVIPESPQREWFYLGLDAVQAQMPYELLPVFILQLPEEGRDVNALPYRTEPDRLTEGSHLSYAIQWFMFAVILGFGYIQYVAFQERRALRIQQLNAGNRSEDDSEGSFKHAAPS